jgi:hypothetical protein
MLFCWLSVAAYKLAQWPIIWAGWCSCDRLEQGTKRLNLGRVTGCTNWRCIDCRKCRKANIRISTLKCSSTYWLPNVQPVTFMTQRCIIFAVESLSLNQLKTILLLTRNLYGGHKCVQNFGCSLGKRSLVKSKRRWE